MLVRLLILLLATIIITAIYPAVVLAAYKPVVALSKKMEKGHSKINIRQVFAVFQFFIAIVLIICGIAIGKQLSFIRNYNTGMSTSNSIVVPFSPAIGAHYLSFEHDISTLNIFEHISAARYPIYKSYDTYFLAVKNSDKQLTVAMLSVDESFIGMMGLKWSVVPSDPLGILSKNTVLLNETAARQLNLGGTPVGERIQFGNLQREVRGVLKDFNFESLKNKIGPLCITISAHTDQSSSWSYSGGYLYGSLKKGIHNSIALSKLAEIYNTYDKENEFEYSYTDDAFSDLYESDNRLEKLAFLSMGVTLLIACFGLYGLAVFIIRQRYREIGIRKVMGAGSGNIMMLITADFIKIIFFAGLLASPVAWWAMNRWLQDFPYRIELRLWMFVSAFAVAALISILTISYQVARAALSNPIRILRSE
jgi:putative ABC transport system permease protein